jgi:hypothetical protein
MTEYWFKPKRFGYGATPIHWKGWASSFVAMFAVLAVMRFMILPVPGGVHHARSEVLFGWIVLVALIVGFSWFARIKTEGEWRWRWGRDSN